MRTRSALLIAAAVTAVVLVVPATGQGKAAGAPALVWSHTPHGTPLITSYEYGQVQQQGTAWFRLGDASHARTGKLTIKLTGAYFSIAENHCSRFGFIGKHLSCWVEVTYDPGVVGSVDSAVLTATAARGGAPAPLDLTGHGWRPTAPRR